MTILTFTSRENKNNVQERKGKYEVFWHLQLIKPKKKFYKFAGTTY